MPKVPAKPPARAARATPAKPAAKPASKPASKPVAKPALPLRPVRVPRVAFPKKNQPPAPDAFAAHMPLPLGKRFEAVRAYLQKQPGLTEDVYFYGPKAGWALRYLLAARPLCALLVNDEHPLGIISLDAATTALVDWKTLSGVAHKARRAAHGSPALLWLYVPLAETGAADFKALLKVKMSRLAAPTSRPPSKADRE